EAGELRHEASLEPERHEAGKPVPATFGFPLVGCADGPSVGACSQETEPFPRAREAQGMEEGGDRAPTCEPGRGRWHGEHRILSQDRSKRIHVAFLPGSHELGHEQPLSRGGTGSTGTISAPTRAPLSQI